MSALPVRPAQCLAPTPVQGVAEFDISALRVFFHVPDHHDVVALRGAVVIFETDFLYRGEIVEGGFYVVETQLPVGGMNWETYDRFNREHGPREPRVRIKTSRRVIRAFECRGDPKSWWFVQPSGWHDGPYADWATGYYVIGKVVGLYQPKNVGEGGEV